MAKGFILKGARGESAGFLQQAGGALRCMARLDGGEARLTVRYADGSAEEQALTLDGREREWPCGAGKAVACAYVARDGRLLLATDEQARRVFETDRVRARPKRDAAAMPRERESEERRAPARPPERARRANDAAAESAPEREAGRERSRAADPGSGGAYALPERRWPPPVCWPDARYVSGRWTQG